MHLSVGDVAVIGVMAQEQTHSHVSQSTGALWILLFCQGVTEEHRAERKMVTAKVKLLVFVCPAV